jgi:mono/diheme cytochrome c family protein
MWSPKLPLFVGLALSTAGCRNEMYDQAKAKALSESDFFANGQTARPLPQDTVPRGYLHEDKAMYAGLGADGKFVSDLPVHLTRELLDRGHERFDIFCSPCHGRQGDGLGMIVQRGFKQPASFHSDRLRQQPIGYFFDVMTQGFGQMSSYSVQVPPEDRWAIAAYLRALQLSQHASVADLTPSDRQQIVAAAAATKTGELGTPEKHGPSGEVQ